MKPRVLSLLPSCTEMIYALGFGASLVGRSHECDYPPECASLPVCTKAPPSSAEGGAGMEEFAYNSPGSALTLNVSLINELQPDVILTRDARLDVDENGFVNRLDFQGEIVSPQPTRLAHLWLNIQMVADTIGASDEAPPLIKQLKNRLVDVIEKVAALSDRPRVACIESAEPLMAAGRWIPDLVEMAGGLNLFGEAGKVSSEFSEADLLQQDPDVLVIMPRGLSLVHARARALTMTGRPEWAGLRTVRDEKVFVTDNRHYFHRPGPRLVESIEMIAEMLHPGKFDHGHRGLGWQPM